jgi:hypothetical protein
MLLYSIVLMHSTLYNSSCGGDNGIVEILHSVHTRACMLCTNDIYVYIYIYICI